MFKVLLPGLIAVVVTMAPAVVSRTAMAEEGDCKALNGSATGSAVSPNEITGSAVFTYNQREYQTRIRVIISSIVPNPDGALTVNATHSFEFFQQSEAEPVVGTIATIDQALFTPTGQPGVFALSAISPLSGGSGIFSHVNGSLTFEGVADLAAGNFAADISGVICRS